MLANQLVRKLATARDIAALLVYTSGLFTGQGIVLVWPYTQQSDRLIIDLSTTQTALALNGHWLELEELITCFGGGQHVVDRRTHHRAALYFGRGPLTMTPGAIRFWDVSVFAMFRVVEEILRRGVLAPYPMRIATSPYAWPLANTLSAKIYARHQAVANRFGHPWVWTDLQQSHYRPAQSAYLYALYTHRLDHHSALVNAGVCTDEDRPRHFQGLSVLGTGQPFLLDAHTLPI